MRLPLCWMIIVLLAGLLFLTGGSSDAGVNSTEKPDRAAGTASTNAKDGAAMVWVPGGTFTIGYSGRSSQ